MCHYHYYVLSYLLFVFSELKQDSSKDVQKERIIVEWKYTQLDYDGDNVLRFKEIRGFHRMVKKLIKPKACAKRFRRFCDSNSNKRIEPTEWTLCLGIDQKCKYALSTSGCIDLLCL